MMTILLFLSEYKEDRAIRPQSLKVTTIPTLMGGNLQWEGKLVSASDPMQLSRGRGPGHGEGLFAKFGPTANFRLEIGQKDPKENQTADSLITDLPEFPEKTQGAINL